MSEQDPKEIELYGQVLNVEATMTLSLTKNGAVADGTDVNIAHVAFDNVEDGITNVRIDYEIISGNAVFEENNQKTIIKFTNSAVSSTVKLIDLSAESGQIKASPYFGPEKAPPPVEYKFSELPFKLSLAVTTDNQIADGVATDAVTATLVDSNNKPVANQQLNFSLPAGAAVQFKAGGQTTSASTGADGKTTVLITDTANADVTVSVKCALASVASVTASIDIHFKAKPIVPDFRLQGIITSGVANDGKPGQVRAIITPATGTPSTSYIVRFSKFGNGIINYYLGTFTPLGVKSGEDGSPEIKIPVTVSSKTTTDVLVHDLETKAGFTNVQAELMTLDGKHVAYSADDSNPRINFAASTPPPPPIQNKPKLKVSYQNWMNGAQRSPYACILVIEAINSYNMPDSLTITSDIDSLKFANENGSQRMTLYPSVVFNTNFYNRGHGEVVAEDPNVSNKSDSARHFHISDSTGTIWKGYLTFVSAQIVDQTPY